MSEKISAKTVKKNVLLSVAVQVVSLAVNFILNLIVPKFISEQQYAFWQTYVLYVGYVGVLHFGLLDGIVLRYSQYDYDELDKPRIRSQFQMLLFMNSMIMMLIILVTALLTQGASRYVFTFVAVGVVAKNIYTYTSYTFQITNRISKYALLVVSMRVIYGIMITVLLLLKVQNFYWFCAADLASDLLGCVVGHHYNKGLYFGKTIPLKDGLKEFAVNISSGVMLMVANWSASLLVGSSKMLVQWHWDDITFGKFSFTFSMSNLFLTFVNAISVVLFPSLKRMDKDKLPQMYMSIRGAISAVLCTLMLFYFPGCWILDLWLPKYHASLTYLGIILPMIIFTSKVSLLTNNYLKAYRKEKTMLLINVFSVAVAFGVFSIMTYVLNNITALLVSVVLVIMMRSVLSELAVAKIISVNITKDFLVEGLVTIGFIISAKFFGLLPGFILYAVIVAVYLYAKRDMILPYIKRIRRKSV